ncbi:uncharacterized protein LOC126902541 [Daktulosphaira vitifoliae]|uniref:uncharacterized protein LOC126902541 n=1 Tax=Daktulosphaira vitifoliae TaxID=58002 RepID=UPI0021AA913B|nr:uncharacterized protein LOC126902541 [Daktulosphaira vitifoliae]
MNFYFFIVMYLAINFSNGLIYDTPITNKDGQLTYNGNLCMTKLFHDIRENDIGMNYAKFCTVLKKYQKIHCLNDTKIHLFFVGIVGNTDGYMTEVQFLSIMAIVLHRVEIFIERFYNSCLKNNVMTKIELIDAFKQYKINLNDSTVTELMNQFAGTNVENISYTVFRDILGYLLHKNNPTKRQS